jgi:hypothetical protein
MKVEAIARVDSGATGEVEVNDGFSPAFPSSLTSQPHLCHLAQKLWPLLFASAGC